ncbi:MAG TPA: HAD-IB family hydrolase [Intrasporangium sp.]|uniref:HAD family hydrolase n=1 Tax=Intrasporangium sp. TaxID=1925024 RepID=UPI002B475C85|nr:HAD-IB family hydrolase [Intrasporangium sp.]HKX67094.1 HAD-IB family hydrolase [Intrasporangium sp.]
MGSDGAAIRPGLRAAAFFDLDRTLIRGSANYPLAIAAFRSGHVPWRDLVRDTINAVSFHRKGSTDAGSAALRERILGAVAGTRQSDVIHLADEIVPGVVRRLIPQSAALLAEAKAAAMDRIVVSASPIELVGRIASALGLEGAVATRSELDDDGRYTGRLMGEFCYRDGKVIEIEKLAAERGYDLAASAAYSDSISDLPMLERVGTAIAVNPDHELRELARERGWRVVEVGRKRR